MGRDRTRRQPAHIDEEGRVPPVVTWRRRGHPHLADDLRPQMQRVLRRLPLGERQWREGHRASLPDGTTNAHLVNKAPAPAFARLGRAGKKGSLDSRRQSGGSPGLHSLIVGREPARGRYKSLLTPSATTDQKARQAMTIGGTCNGSSYQRGMPFESVRLDPGATDEHSVVCAHNLRFVCSW